MFFSCSYVYCLLLLAAGNFKLVFAQENFNVSANSYNSLTNMICWGSAHSALASDLNNKTLTGRLSLIYEEANRSTSNSGLAYYNREVRMLDPSSRQSASFNTSFAIDQNMQFNASPAGDGLAFVISANNSTLGSSGEFLGIFGPDGTTSYKSIVVEFDVHQNTDPLALDISGNHVSFDFHNITWVAAANASDVDVVLWYNLTIYAWVEYSAEMQQLQLRISNNKSRPINPLLNYTVDLFDVVEEYMSVGFSAGSGDTYNHYYIGDWTFESYGITPQSAPVPTPSPQPSSKSSNDVGTMVGIFVGVSMVGVPILLALVGACILVCQWRLGSPSSDEEDPIMELSSMPGGISYKELSAATGAFSDCSKLGEGGFGSVHRGILPPKGTPIAVKRISADSKQGEPEFMAEVSIISQLRHRNLIELLGWCKGRGKYLLVYELMPKGSLDKALFLSTEVPGTSLSWPQRFNIVSGTAAALNYLHENCNQQVIHRDVKASNIMLDNEWNAKLGDFGLARLVDHLRTASTTEARCGTWGYIAPETTFGRFTVKTDVFAFGAVALEVACGRPAYESSKLQEEKLLVDWVWRCLSEGDLLSVVDRRLKDYDTYWMEVVLLTGLICSHPNPSARPSMGRVVEVLKGVAPVPEVPVFKPFAVFPEDAAVIKISDLLISNSKTFST